ncbi:MAG: HNH endonuclease, partial [Acidimicrobiia bacterium]|nr:HNH endonuclease [Acidimicrobiia bacterium]
SRRSDGAAARDEKLIEQIKAANPDQARSMANAWLDEHSRHSADGEHERQRRLRKVSTYSTDRGTKALHAEGDRVSIDQMWKAIEALTNKLYQDDGGRDAKSHPRTRDQRRFDALHILVNERPGHTWAGPSRRPGIVAVGHLDDNGDLTSADLVEGGRPPASVLEQLKCHADLYGVLFRTDGQPLRLGRRVRTVSNGQWIALVARDRGCVLCGADPQYCEAHHILPWNAPARGRTDITNLVLLCSSCHHHTHDSKQTVTQDAETGTWRLRPATPEETPPPRAQPPP